jgi:hypothetical protein
MPFYNTSFFWDRFSRRKNNGSAMPFNGLVIASAITPTGEAYQAITFGPHDQEARKEKRAQAIEIAPARGERPVMEKGKLISAAVEDSDEHGTRFVRPKDDTYMIRVFRTGFIGKTDDDIADLRVDNKKPRFHGAFALDMGSARAFAEGEDVGVVSGQVREINNDFGAVVRGMKGIVRWRERGFEIPEGGAVICGDLGQELTIHERKGTKIHIYDVSTDTKMQKLFESMLAAEKEQRRKDREAIAAAATAPVDSPA